MPTIVFGYFALTFFTPEILQALGIEVGVYNGLSAGLIMGLLVLPDDRVDRRGRDVGGPAVAARRRVRPRREPHAGLAADRFPAALSGIVAALVLGASRAIGETVLVLVAGGQSPNLGIDPRESYQTMAAFIASIARGDIPTGSIEYKTIFAVGFTLFVFTLVLNMISIGSSASTGRCTNDRRADRGLRHPPRQREGQGRHVVFGGLMWPRSRSRSSASG